MKGTNYNGSHFANKGTSRSEGESMFSVGNLVAFSYSHYCSPDGRSSSRGCCPTTESYFLQEEIVLEEYDNTESDRYGSGNYDVKRIVELEDVFWHEYSTQIRYKTFLLQILESDTNVFTNGFIHGDITEVRNNPGKFLHVYEIPENYRECESETFTETVKKINLLKKQADDFEAEKVSKNYRGIELEFGITGSGWYASKASFGRHSVQLQHEHDSTSRSHYRIMIMPCVPSGCSGIGFYLPNEIPVILHLFSGEPIINTRTSTSWCNSQSWHYDEIKTLQIERGWIFVDGVDVYNCTKAIIEKNREERIAASNQKFSDAKQRAMEVGFSETQVMKIAKMKRGRAISKLGLATDMVIKYKIDTDFCIETLSMLCGTNAGIYDYMYLLIHAKEIKLSKIQTALKKAYAWKYLRDLIPGYGFGNFDDAMAALELALANKVPFKSSEIETFGAENSESDLAVKLRDALLEE